MATASIVVALLTAASALLSIQRGGRAGPASDGPFQALEVRYLGTLRYSSTPAPLWSSRETVEVNNSVVHRIRAAGHGTAGTRGLLGHQWRFRGTRGAQ